MQSDSQLPATPPGSAPCSGSAASILSRIQNYLGNGGLFNPKMMVSPLPSPTSIFTEAPCTDYDSDCDDMTVAQIIKCAACAGPLKSRGRCVMKTRCN